MQAHQQRDVMLYVNLYKCIFFIIQVNFRNSWCHLQGHNSVLATTKSCDCHYNSSHIEIYSDGDSKGGHDSINDQRPPLPPRPPPPPPRLRNSTITGNGKWKDIFYKMFISVVSISKICLASVPKIPFMVL